MAPRRDRANPASRRRSARRSAAACMAGRSVQVHLNATLMHLNMDCLRAKLLQNVGRFGRCCGTWTHSSRRSDSVACATADLSPAVTSPRALARAIRNTGADLPVKVRVSDLSEPIMSGVCETFDNPELRFRALGERRNDQALCGRPPARRCQGDPQAIGRPNDDGRRFYPSDSQTLFPNTGVPDCR